MGNTELKGALRRERLARGWSLQRVAEELRRVSVQVNGRVPGVNPDMIGLWERGVKKPSPYYREKLCMIYEATADELGLASPDDFAKRNMLQSAHTHDALVRYVQLQRQRLGSAVAPGATGLRVEEIIKQDGLFIPPLWSLLHGSTSQQNLIDYLMDALLCKQRVLLLGDAGQGKTTILKILFTRLADHFLEDSSSSLPVYIPLREYTAFAENAVDSLWAHVGEDFPLPYEQFASLVRNKQVIFLFDGFDEIRGPMTQRTINERAASKIFRYPSLLSCRRSFFNFYLTMSVLQECYPQQIDLQPLPFNSLVTHYITTFCLQRNVASSEKIIDTLQVTPELQDLAKRPLLLVMILEVLSELGSGTGEMLDERWSIAKLYRRYTERWLKLEAAKPDAVLKWHEKNKLLQELAWQTILHATFTLEELHAFVQNVLPRYGSLKEDQLLDDLCFRTLLGAAEGSTYAFLHKSFQEYYVARYVFEAMHRQDALAAIEHVFHDSLAFDIATFLKKMLRECSLNDKAVIAANLMRVCQQRDQEQTPEAITIRQQATYYLSNLQTGLAARFLEQIWERESNKWVQRGIMLGLALYFGKATMLERYMDIIREDAQAAAINLVYHLIYYGDQAGNMAEMLDATVQTVSRSEKTVAALFRHLQHSRYKNGWPLDLFTLSTLLERQGPSILLTHAWYVPFLKAFLEQDHREQGVVLLQEKERLYHLITQSESIEGAFLGTAE